jgi:catechol 2,3-dioxygenase-like lactoylglutathione lyase family enzyme
MYFSLQFWWRVAAAPTVHESEKAMTGDVIHPTFHHVTLKTTRLREMIDFYVTLVGAEVIHQDRVGAWLTNDRANHRIALLASPVLNGGADKERHTGLHHIAYEYAGLAELNAAYLRLREAGIEPAFCLDHRMTLSYYALVLLRRPRRQPRRAADGRLRRLGVVEGMDEELEGVQGRLGRPAL